MRLTLVRHGESVDNIKNICQGQTHGELSPKGIDQAQAVASQLVNTRYDICYTSDLYRACQTSDVIVSKQNLSDIKDIRLRERYFGKYQGLMMSDNWDGLAEYEGAETMTDMVRRIEDFISEIRQRFTGKDVLVISHGITLRLLVGICLNSDCYPKQPDNCSISLLESKESTSLDLIEYNNVSHLK